jgi:uncharacterized protein YlbG (UPF0298 family)
MQWDGGGVSSRSSVAVAVVHLGHMRMRMIQRFEAIAVAARTRRHRVMYVPMMAVVVPMRMFVLQRVVSVFVAT